MKKLALTVSIGLVLLISLSCEFITSQFHISGTTGTDTPETGATPVQEGLPKATATLALEATATLAPEATIATDHGTGQIVFVSCKSQDSVGMGTQCGIYIMDADGSNMRQLTDLDDDIAPALSPDGTQVVFTSLQRDGNHEIYVINTDGSGLTRLTTNKGEDISPSWSPDGSQIAYMSDLLGPGDPSQLYMFVMGADGSNPHPLTKSKGDNHRWSPDGSQIVFVTGKNNLCYLNIMNADGTHAQVVKTNPVENIASPVWSPDGTQIAFFSQKTITGPAEVNVIDKDGKNQHSLSAGFHVIFGGLSWSPDGQKILFSMRGDGKSLQGNPQLYIVNADGSNLHKLDAPCTYCWGADWGH